VADKVRLRRKDIKQPDEFITLTTQAAIWARGHQTAAIGIGVGAVAILLAIGIATAYHGARVRDANADLSRALTKLEANDFQAATDRPDRGLRPLGRDRDCPAATLLAANAAVDAGNPDAAIAELGKLQAQSGSLPWYLQQQTLVAWGVALEAKHEWLDAAEKYKQAAALTGPYTGAAVLGEARTRELGGETDRARELYRQAYEQFPRSPAARPRCRQAVALELFQFFNAETQRRGGIASQ
jgi:tetratricopeptide (TPR) repeat protein